MSSILTAKRPVGILRYNAEIMRNNGAPQEAIADYLSANGADIDLITSVPTPNENELARMVQSEQDGTWAQRQQQAQAASEKAQKSAEKLEDLRAAQGAVRSFGNGLFLNYGDELESALTGQDVNQIRAEQSEWAARNPEWDLALGLAGGMAPALAGFGAAGAAGKTATTRALLGGASGAGLGGVAGFGAGEGGLGNRLESGLVGAGFGGAIGTAAPVALGMVGRSAGRIARGLGQNKMSEKEIGDFLLNNVVSGAGKPGSQAMLDASVLLQGAQTGDTAILNAAKNLENKMIGMSKMNDPTLVELASNPSWTPQTPSAQSILSAMTTDAKRTAQKEYATFAGQQPEKTGAGLALNNFFKNNPVAAKIVSANQRRIGNEMTTYEGLKNIQETLRLNLPKNMDTSRAVNRNAQILDAIDDIKTLRETLFPGQTLVDAKYAATVNAIQEPAESRARAYVSQIAKGVPFTDSPEVSLTGAGKLAFKPYVRGKARELMLKGTLEPDTTSTAEKILQGIGFGGYRTLEREQ